MSLWSYQYQDIKPNEGDKICYILKGSKDIDYGTYESGSVSTPDRVIPWTEIYMWKVVIQSYINKEVLL